MVLKSFLHSLKRLILNNLLYLDYKTNMILNKPYFGKYMTAGQAWPQRRKVMFQTLKRERAFR